MTDNTANGEQGYLSEIFSSVQGEGLYLGVRQLFIRTALCNLNCRYCDTSDTASAPDCFRLESEPGSGVFRKCQNPVTPDMVMELLTVYDGIRHHSVSLTGGEPLLQAEFLKGLLKKLKSRGFEVHLETNGTLFEQLKSVIDLVDVVAMDIKMPSAAAAGNLWDCHRKFLEIAAEKNVFVKIVVTEDTPDQELDLAANLVAAKDKKIPLIVQPVTDINGICRVSGSRLLKIQERLLKTLRRVMVIPQTHRMIKGIL